jgi:O-antigen ligase
VTAVTRGSAVVAPHTGRASLRGRLEIAYTALVVLLVSEPAALNFGRLLPVLVPVALLELARLGLDRDWRARLHLPAGLVLLVLWLGITVCWSGNRAITLVQCSSTVLVIGVGLIMGNLRDPMTVIRGVSLGASLAAGISIAYGTFSSAGRTPAGYEGGALQGVYEVRNILAEVLALALPYVLLQLRFKRRGGSRVSSWIQLSLVLVALVATRVSTALIALIVCCGVAVFWWAIRRTGPRKRHVTLLAGAILLILTGGWAASNQAIVLSGLGRDETFTGRLVIWSAVQEEISRSPLGGFGWGAVWGVDGGVERYVVSTVRFAASSSHSGYLDFALQAGYVGLALILLTISGLIAKSFVAVWRGALPFAILGLMYSLNMLVYSLTEPTLTTPFALFLLSVAIGLHAPRGRDFPDHV